ncbi:type II toxin-antitoxin system Phd/YefM family antitoxin [candidate division KSB1 bacterium]|nr:type II toxin-antitoxin system Phd/YefM family antitoxin [candidate division KSB1 bacterium]
MRSINIHEAKTNLSRIAEEVAAGEEVIVVKAVKPKMKLVPIDNIKKKIKLGALKGKIQISKDFDAPLPPNIIDEFYGRNQ